MPAAKAKAKPAQLPQPEDEVINVKPQPKQEQFLSSSADIVIYGGAAGGGKTYALLMEALRHISNKDFGAVLFRRTIQEIIKEGGVLDESRKIYPLMGGVENGQQHKWTFESGARVTFAHIQYEQDLETWKSSQIPLMLFDQLETFTEKQFFYMLSRNRSTSGVRPYVRATANPQPGWLANLLDWWIAEDGYADLSRNGKVRWFVRDNEVTHWGNTREELKAQFPKSQPKSLAFILSTIFDNKILMEKDPGYLANLMAQSLVDKERLLGDKERGGNWKIQPQAGKLFNRAWFKIVPAAPAGMDIVRFWDMAATEKKGKGSDPDYTASVKMGRLGERYYVLDMTADQIEPAETDSKMKNLATQDKRSVRIRFEREGGASGKRDAVRIVSMLSGWDVQGTAPSGDKITRAKGLAAQALAGNVYLVEGDWNEPWLAHMHAQPDAAHDDIMDGSSGAFNELSAYGGPTNEELGRFNRAEVDGSTIPDDMIQYMKDSGIDVSAYFKKDK